MHVFNLLFESPDHHKFLQWLIVLVPSDQLNATDGMAHRCEALAITR